MIRPRRLLAELAVLGAAVLVMAALGPFGSYAVPAGARLAQWALFLMGGYLCFRPVIAAGGALSVQSGLPLPAAIGAACLFATLPTSMIVALVSAGDRWQAVSIGAVAAIYPQVLIVGATVTIVQMLVRRARSVGEWAPSRSAASAASPAGRAEPLPPAPIAAGDAAASAGQAPAFLDLLPPRLGHDVICLENEDHYIRVHTSAGNAMILMRMRDAVAQLAGVEGERVHRGWWVARHAVAGVVRQERSLRLRLKDGREVPVARSAVPHLRDRGWLEGAPVDIA